MTTYRQTSKSNSNNADNPNQNICIKNVCDYFGVSSKVRYLHNSRDVVKALRTKFIVRSRLSSIKSKTVGGARKELAKLTASMVDNKVFGYYISVKGHGILLDSVGNTIVDTSPRKRDKRNILGLRIIYK